MASNDEIFAKEFLKAMKDLKATYGYQELNSIPIPDELKNVFIGAESFNKVFISNINDEYYGKLSNTEALLLKGYDLRKRKYDHKSEFMRDKNGNIIYIDVPCPNKCYGIATDINISVPAKYKVKNEHFEFVDYQERTTKDGRKERKYIYIVPKKYLYKINQTALVFSWRKLPKTYAGVALFLRNGSVLYVHIIPYKVGIKPANYRIVHCKTTDDYSKELEILRDYWLKIGYIFNPDQCELTEPYKDRDNMAYQRLDGSMDIYEKFDLEKSLDGDTSDNLFDEGDSNYSL